MHKCKSSNIDWVDYDESTQTLKVCFSGGNEYHYVGVKPLSYQQLTEAESTGKHFSKFFKDKYTGVKQEKKDK